MVKYVGANKDFLIKLIKSQKQVMMSGNYELTLYYNPKTNEVFLHRGE